MELILAKEVEETRVLKVKGNDLAEELEQLKKELKKRKIVSCNQKAKRRNKEAIWLYAELFLGHHDGSCHGLW